MWEEKSILQIVPSTKSRERVNINGEIVARLVDTQLNPNGLGLGLKKKKPEAGPGRVRVFVKTWLELGPEPTWLQVNTKKTLLYIYIHL